MNDYPDDLSPKERGGYVDEPDSPERGCLWWILFLAVVLVVVVAAIAGMAWMSNV